MKKSTCIKTEKSER